MMQPSCRFSAVILAGGLGTRLRPAFSDGPKCLAPIAGRPFVAYQLRQLREAGITDVLLCIGYKAADVEQAIGDGREFGVGVRYGIEEIPLGTAGALRSAAPLINARRFFVLNGDSLVYLDFLRMSQFHAGHQALGTIALARVPHAARFGTVRVDSSHRVTGFVEKEMLQNGTPALINAGVYLLNREFISRIPERVPASLERDVFPALLNDGLYGFDETGWFIDIGLPDDFERAQHELPRRFPA